MKQKLLAAAYSNITATINVLETLKSLDIKTRRRAKASAKRAWTKRITHISKILTLLKSARKNVRSLPKRVAK